MEVSKFLSCNIILAVNNNFILFSNFLLLPRGYNESVKNLIRYYIIEQNKYSFYYNECKLGNYKGYGWAKKVLLNTPNYLLIDFEGYNKTLKHLVEKLDLSEYKSNNRGPNIYLLYAFITKSNEQYIVYVKDDEDDSCISYSNETTENKESSISFDYAPYYAIYKGIDLN